MAKRAASLEVGIGRRSAWASSQAAQVGEQVAESRHRFQPTSRVACLKRVVLEQVVRRAVVGLALGILAEPVIGAADGKLDRRLDLGLPDERLTDLHRGPVQRLPRGQAVGGGLLAGSARSRSPSIRNRLMAAALAACAAGLALGDEHELLAGRASRQFQVIPSEARRPGPVSCGRGPTPPDRPLRRHRRHDRCRAVPPAAQ